MNFFQVLAIIVSLDLIALVIFQFLLALGFPYGRFAWGGQHERLPGHLRISSVIAAFVLLFANYLLLVKVELLDGFSIDTVGLLVLFFGVYFGINTLTNLLSKSKSERYMALVSGWLCIGFLIITFLS